MSYNGSGTFQINTSGQPVVTGTVISSSAFNALTADLATGLSTAITKDGQTATTVRIPFAQGINSSLATDTSSGSTGSIYTAGGVGITKGLFVGGTATFSATPVFSALTASSAVATDASKNLVSVANTGTGNNVLSASPTLTGTIAGASLSLSSLTASSAVATDASKNLVSVTNTGTGNNVLATSPTLVTPALGTPASGILTNCTGLPQAGLAANVAGNGPAFSAYPSATTSLVQYVATKITYGTEEWDTNSNFASSRFTPTVAGYYQVNASTSMATGAASTYIYVYKNGAVYKSGNLVSSATSSWTIVSCQVYLNGSTDYIEIYVQQNNATQTNETASNSNYFQAAMIRSA